MKYPGKVKLPVISNHFAKCDHKGELSAVFSAIYYPKMSVMSFKQKLIINNNRMIMT